MKKLNKLVLGVLVVLAIVVTPKVLASNDDSETIVLSKSNLLILSSEVNGDSVSAVISKAKELDLALSKHRVPLISDGQPLYLFLNSPGGSIQSGLELIEALQGMGRKVNTVTLFSASMAFQIAQNLGDRLILKNGVTMSHHAAGEIEGSFGGVEPSQMDSRYRLWRDRVRELDEQTVKRTNGKKTYEQYTKEYDHELWLTGTKAVAEGYSDKVVLVKCDASLSGVTTMHTSFMGMEVSYDLDNCPINTSPQNVQMRFEDGKTINKELEKEIRNKFLSRFTDKQKQVVPMIF